MVRHGDACRTMLHRESRVVGRENALHHHRQRRDAAQPLQRLPAQRRVELLVDVLQQCAARARVDDRLVEVRGPDICGHTEVVAVITLAQAGSLHIHREADRRVPRRRRALHERARDLAIAVHVQLEPARCRRRLRHRLERLRAECAEHLHRALGCHGTCHRTFAIGMRKAVQRTRRGHDRHRDRHTEHRRAQVARTHVHQHARHEPQPVPRQLVLAYRDLIPGTTGVIVIRRLCHAHARLGLEIARVQQQGHDRPVRRGCADTFRP